MDFDLIGRFVRCFAFFWVSLAFARPLRPVETTTSRAHTSSYFKEYHRIVEDAGPDLESLQRRTQAATLSRAAGGEAFPPPCPEPQRLLALVGPQEGAIIPFEPPQPEQDDPAGLDTHTAQALVVLRKAQRLAARRTTAQLHEGRSKFTSWSKQKQSELPPDITNDPLAALIPVPVGSFGGITIHRAVCVPSVDATIDAFERFALQKASGFRKKAGASLEDEAVHVGH